MLLENIKNEITKARKASDSVRLSILTALYAESAIVGKNDGNRASTDQEVMAVAKKFIKNNVETIDTLTKKGIDVAYLEAENNVYSEFLPKQLSEAELRLIVNQIILDNGLTVVDNKLVGTVMKELKIKYEGAYDAKLAKQIIDSTVI